VRRALITPIGDQIQTPGLDPAENARQTSSARNSSVLPRRSCYTESIIGGLPPVV